MEHILGIKMEQMEQFEQPVRITTSDWKPPKIYSDELMMTWKNKTKQNNSLLLENAGEPNSLLWKIICKGKNQAFTFFSVQTIFQGNQIVL